MVDLDEMIDLIEKLNEYRDYYYNKNISIVSDEVYDELFDKLYELELQNKIEFSNSPTQTVGYEVKSKLEKVKHSHLMLSLDKTKDIDKLNEFKSNKDCLLMHKLDGLSILLTYDKGNLVRAETRGNGDIGEDVTHNAKVFCNVPLTIPHDGKLEVEGEAIIDYETFLNINENLPENEKYKNQRNLASGSVRQLNSEVSHKRKIRFIAWKTPCGIENNSFSHRLNELRSYGFETVQYLPISQKTTIKKELLQRLKHFAEMSGYPIDGLVITYDDIQYGESLGYTGHHPKHSFAFKFKDEEIETTLESIEWSMGKYGTLTPVAVFETVNIDGTDVSRASLHNVSILKELQLGIGDTITVYKANQIIPQVKENLTKTNDIEIPTTCPICKKETFIDKAHDTEVLICSNSDCKGALLGKLTHFVSKNAMNIDGLSESTISKFIELGWLSSLKDIYSLKEHKDEMLKQNGFGGKSVEKLLSSIENSKVTTLDRFIYSLSIQLIGRTASKAISRHLKGDYNEFIKNIKLNYDFSVLDDFGETMSLSLKNYVADNFEKLNELGSMLVFETENVVTQENTSVTGKTFVITGSLEHYKNRDELKGKIESLGGKVSGSVSSKTDYLINNDTQSTSGKNKKALELNVKIISENDFNLLLQNGGL